MRRLRLGTRPSRLALIQSELVAARLRASGTEVELITIVTEGDLRAKDAPIKDGVFVKDLEHALLNGAIDLAVHSAKDLPLDPDPRLPIAAFPVRADPLDALVTRAGERTVQELPAGARVGTDSPRRSAFLCATRPDLQVIPLMGNVDMRVRRLDAGEAEALVLAAAGLDRLGLHDRIAAHLDARLMPPAPAQGALAVQVRCDDEDVLARVREIDDPRVRLAVVAERAVLKAIGGGCDAPVGALATVSTAGDVSLLAGASTCGGDFTRVFTTTFGGDMGRAACAVAEELLRHVPLRTRAILDTRPELDDFGAELLARRGWRVIHVPAVATEHIEHNAELDRARSNLAAYQWVVLTSKRGVAALFDGMQSAVPASTRFAAVGPTTAKALHERNVKVDAQPELAVGDEIPRAMAGHGLRHGDRVLLARADLGSESLPEQLRLHGAEVDDVGAYRTIPAPPGSREPLVAALADPLLEAVVFASGSAVRGLVELAGRQAGRARRLRAFVIGPRTNAAAQEHGFTVAGEAPTPDAAGLVASVKRYFDEEVTRWVELQLPRSR